jgi:RNA polymerase sigma-70 factor (ECF subfamily)
MRPSFEHVVREYYQPLYRFACSLSGSAADAADLTQQAYVAWAEQGHQLRDDTKVKSWLFTTLYREFLKGRRRLDRFPQVEISEVESELPAIAPNAVERLAGTEVMSALDQVDEVFRTPLTLFYIGGQSYAEIAETLDVPTGTVMSRISRAKQQLRSLLSGLVAERRHEGRRADGARSTP